MSSRLAHLYILSAGLMTSTCEGVSPCPTDGRRTSYDIYHDSNVAEAVKARQCLLLTKGRISELLAEWPEHPLLLQVHISLINCDFCSHRLCVMHCTTKLNAKTLALIHWL